MSPNTLESHFIYSHNLGLYFLLKIYIFKLLIVIFLLTILKSKFPFLSWLSGLEHPPVHQKIVGLIPGQGEY